MPKVKLRQRTQTVLKIKVSVLQRDIDDGECGLTTRCMHRVALTRALKDQLGLDDEQFLKLHVRVDAARMRFNFDGYRWVAPTPIIAKDSLIIFDDPTRGKPFVKPHRYTITAARTSKIVPFTRDRQDQINKARQRRIAEGRPDKIYSSKTIHQRVVGMALGRG